MRVLILGFTLFLAQAASAATVTITNFFDIPLATSFSTDGFDFESADVFLGNSVLAWSPNVGFAMSSSDLLPFALESMELRDPATTLYRIVGTLSGGGTIQQDATTGAGFTQVYFGSEWQNLSSIYVSSLGGSLPQVDNIVVNVVPIPAAVWLFGSGLGLLGWLRRRQTA